MLEKNVTHFWHNAMRKKKLPIEQVNVCLRISEIRCICLETNPMLYGYVFYFHLEIIDKKLNMYTSLREFFPHLLYYCTKI